MADGMKEKSKLGIRARLHGLGNIPPLFRMVWHACPKLVVSNVLLRLVASVIPVARLWVAKLIIDQVVAPAAVAPRAAPIWELVVAELVLALLTEVCSRVVTMLESLTLQEFSNYISMKLMAHSIQLDLAVVEQAGLYDQLERSQRLAGGKFDIFRTFALTAQQLTTLVAYASVVAMFSPWILLALVGAVVPAFFLETRFGKLMHSLIRKQTALQREVEYLRYLSTNREGAKEVRIFGLKEYLLNRSKRVFDGFYREFKDLWVKRTVYGSMLSALPTLCHYGAYAFIIYRATQGSLSVGTLTLLAGALLSARSMIEGVYSNFAQIVDSSLVIGDLFEFLNTQPSIRSAPNAILAPRPIQKGIEFRNVSFCYPGSDRKVLDNISFVLHANERVALVGENGAGKTTLVKLLSRLYDPTEGAIFLDGVNLRDYDVDDLHRQIGVVFQDYVRYEMLVKENIAIGSIDEIANQSRIEHAARLSEADEIIKLLPRKYDQMLGSRFQNAVDLSMGQWQTIALSRAYLRNAQVLILDEPTASLDARAETTVYQRFTELTQGRMAILISHRFSTVRMADRILVLSGSRIREEGSHQELVALGGRYAELFALQANAYR